MILFGRASAPHLARRVLMQLAEDEGSKFPTANRVLTHDCYVCYVDDVMTGEESAANAKIFFAESIHLAKAGVFTLRKWLSNSPEVVESTLEDVNSTDILIVRIQKQRLSEFSVIGSQTE